MLEAENKEVLSPFLPEPPASNGNRKTPKWGFGVICLQLITLLALLILLILFGLTFQSKDAPQKKLKKPQTGNKTEVPLIAHQMEGMAGLKGFFEAKIQPNLDPCQDFYEFACGKNKHKQNNDLKGQLNRHFEQFTEMASQIDLAKVDKYHLKAYSYLKAMGSALQNKEGTSESEKKKISEKMNQYLERLGGTPLHKARYSNINVFKTAFQLLENFAFGTLFVAIRSGIVQQDRPPRRLALVIHISGNFLEKNLTFPYTDEYLNKREMQRKVFHVKKISTEKLQEMANCQKNAYGVDLEWKSKIPMFYEDLKKCCPNLAAALPSDHMKGKEIYFNLHYNNTHCFLHSDHVKELYKIVNENWQTVQALMMENFVGMMNNLSQNYTQKLMELSQHFLVEGRILSYATLHLFLNNTGFKKESLVKISTVIEEIRLGFKEKIQKVKWMDPMTKIQAINKLNHITPKFVGPPMVFDDEKFFKYYQHLPMLNGTESRLDIYITISRQTYSKLFEKLGNGSQTVDSDFPIDFAFNYNAFYLPMDNSITLFFPLFLPPYFSWNYPSYFIYGTLGMTIAHELGHAFDPVGIQIDAEGNQRQWCRNESLKTFRNKAQCYIDQYSRFTKTDPENGTNIVPIIGTETVRETLSDDVGLKVAYSAFKRSQERENTRKYANFKEMNEEQLFFLSFATYFGWAMSLGGSDRSHPPARVRVLGTLRNNQEFQKAFKCEENSGMNPKEKCNLF